MFKKALHVADALASSPNMPPLLAKLPPFHGKAIIRTKCHDPGAENARRQSSGREVGAGLKDGPTDGAMAHVKGEVEVWQRGRCALE